MSERHGNVHFIKEQTPADRWSQKPYPETGTYFIIGNTSVKGCPECLAQRQRERERQFALISRLAPNQDVARVIKFCFMLIFFAPSEN